MSRAWNRYRLNALGNHALVRVALHPVDAGHAGVLADWRYLLEKLALRRTGVLESRWLRERLASPAIGDRVMHHLLRRSGIIERGRTG